MTIPILSVIIITHNQKELFKRCIDSVLCQDIKYDYEIIVSDDASKDGTWELINEYMQQYPNIVYGYQVNSNDCDPLCTIDRSSYNRCNGYSHSRGKYISHMDGDDYYRGTSCLTNQISLLEQHPQCHLCMQNVLVVEDGKDYSTGHYIYKEHRFKTGQILTAKDFICGGYYAFHSAFMFRRNPDFNPAVIYNICYDDSVITYHHLQFGSIVCLDQADCLYIRYNKSSSAQLSQDEQELLFGLDLTISSATLFPSLRQYIYLSDINRLLHVINLIRSKVALSSDIKAVLRRHGSYIFKLCTNNTYSKSDVCRLQFIKLYIIFLKKLHISSKQSIELLHKLLTVNSLNLI